MDFWELDQKQKHELDRDAIRHQSAIERQRIAANQRERLKEIERETRILLDEQQWERKPEEYEWQHRALLDKLTAEIQFIELELTSRRGDQALTNLLQQIDEQLTMRRDLIKLGWSLLMQSLFTGTDDSILSREEQDEVREIAKRVATMANEDQAHREKVSDGLEKLRKIEEQLRKNDEPDDDQFGFNPSRI